MTAESELKAAFAEVGTQIKDRVKSVNGLHGIWYGLREDFDALPVKDPLVMYVIKKPEVL